MYFDSVPHKGDSCSFLPNLGLSCDCADTRVEWNWYYVTSQAVLHRGHSFHLALSFGLLTRGTQPPYCEEAQVTGRECKEAFWRTAAASSINHHLCE